MPESRPNRRGTTHGSVHSGQSAPGPPAFAGRLQFDPTRVITHTLPLDEAERGFDIFKNKQDHCERVVLKP